ncbi:MAG: condensation domain-containing protein, partial [Acidobacteria bacterium]|nr:condensation domain-containing protein [Acidobacteriota bacterium]
MEIKKITKTDIEDIISLTPLQEGMLFHYLQAPQSRLYCEQLSLEISGAIDIKVFAKAWNIVTKTNEMLRTLFRWEKVEKPSQIILKKHPCRLISHDLSSIETERSQRVLNELKEQDLNEGFDLRQVPFRVTLIKLAEKKFVMIISYHHILYDGWSNGIILKEFFNTYRQLSNGETVSPAAKPGFKIFLKWIKQQDTAKQEKFWENYLKEAGANPAGKRKKTREACNTANGRFQFPTEVENKLDTFIKNQNITMASLLYSAWGILLQKYHDVNDTIFDATVSGRSNNAGIKGIENMVGLFINTLPLRIQTLPGETVSTFLSRTYHMLQQWSEFENSAILPVREMLDKCRQETLLNSVVVFENYPLDSLTFADTAPLSLHSFSIVERTLYDLTIIITTIGRIEFNITYNNDLFNEAVISRLFEHLVLIVEAMVTDPGKEIPAIDIWSVSERERFLEHIRVAGKKESEMESGYTAPRDELEEKLAAIWAEVLNINKDIIGIDHNFFAFGGHSLKASYLASRFYPDFGVRMPLGEIFNRPTIRKLTEYIRKAAKLEYIPIPPAEAKEYYEASPGQRRLYMLQQLNPESTAYNGPWCLRLKGLIDKERLENAFKHLIQRHEILRTSFELWNGEPVQRIHDHVEFAIETLATDACGIHGQTRTLTEVFGPTFFQKGGFIQPFDLSKVPLLRVQFVREKGDRHILMVDMHHIITDG